jgi:hypothetical protein
VVDNPILVTLEIVEELNKHCPRGMVFALYVVVVENV